MNELSSTVWHTDIIRPKIKMMCAHFDGGKKETLASCGWHLQGSPGFDLEGETVWHTLAWGSVLLEDSVSSVEAELAGLVESTRATISWAKLGKVSFDNCRVELPTQRT